MAFPHLRLRDPAISLVDLPWEDPLAGWLDEHLAFRELPIGPSRHLVRFLVVDGALVALKEEPITVARREYEVLTLIADGLENQQVADELIVSVETVRTHVRNAMNKLGARTRAQAIAVAMRDGEIPS